MPKPPKLQAGSNVPSEGLAPENQDSSNLNPSTANPPTNSSFETAAQQTAPNVIFEFIDFLLHNKKWWLTPIILVLLVFSVFIALTSSAIAPFIYVLF